MFFDTTPSEVQERMKDVLKLNEPPEGKKVEKGIVRLKVKEHYRSGEIPNVQARRLKELLHQRYGLTCSLTTTYSYISELRKEKAEDGKLAESEPEELPPSKPDLTFVL